MKLRIATWNLARPTKRRTNKLNGLIEKMKSVEADVWIVTETNSCVTPGEGYKAIASDAIEGEIRYAEGENRTTIWTRLNILKIVPTQYPETTVCAAIASPFGKLLVYGTVIPYHAAGGRWPYRFNGENITGKRQWSLHYMAIEYHATVIGQLRRDYPDYHLCFGGDLNQSRDGRKWLWNQQWYGTHLGRKKLSSLLSTNRMQCVTEGDYIETGQLTSQSPVDHLCFDESFAKLIGHVEPWEAGRCKSGKRLTDHSGIWVDLQATN